MDASRSAWCRRQRCARSPEFDLPVGALAVAITNLFELPFAVPLPEESLLFVAEDRTPDWDGIGSEATIEILQGRGSVPVLDPGHVLTTRLVFRSSTVRTELPLQAADVAFANWVEPLLTRRLRAQRARTFRRMKRLGAYRPVSVVAGTRILPRPVWDKGDADDVIETSFDFCLTFLNQFLVAVAAGSGDARIDALARGGLPFLCPVILEAVGTPNRVGTTFVRVIHEAVPDIADRAPLPRPTLEAASRFAVAGRRGDEPLFLFYELFHGAQAAILRGKYSESVVLCSTATETLVNVILTEVLSVQGRTRSVQGVLSAPFASRVSDHLPRATHAQLDRHDVTNVLGRWWQDAYLLRNRSVHEGYSPTRQEAVAARDATFALADTLGSGLRTDAATRDLGERLRISPPDA